MPRNIPFAQDPLTRIINVQWGAAVEPQLGAAVTQFSSQVASQKALTISGWIRLRSGTPSAIYPVMTFGGAPNAAEVGYSDVSISVQPSGKFTINATFVGVPSAAQTDGSTPFSRAGYDLHGWFDFPPGVDDVPGAPLVPVDPPIVHDPPLETEQGLRYITAFGAYRAACAGPVVPPHTGCFQIEVDDACLGSQINVGSGQLLDPNVWHHVIWAIDTGGQSPWGDELVEVWHFVNGLPGLTYDEGFLGRKLAILVGLEGGLEGVGTGINIKNGTVAIPRPSNEVNNWTQTNRIQLCDWQIYPRMINPGQNIGSFFRLQNGVRKRVSTKIAEQAFGTTPSNDGKPRAQWMFKGGGGAFHKSGPRSTDGTFVKTGVIKTVRAPPLWRATP